MRGYGQFCPVAKASEILNERWTLLVIRELIAGSSRFNELRRGLPLMSPTLLTQRLRFLEEAGIVRRDNSGSGRGSRYCLTESGQELGPVVEMLGVWGQRWVRSNLTNDDLDAGLLMWDIHRNIESATLPRRRIVVQVTLVDAPKAKRLWWLVMEPDSDPQLCLFDPGYDVDLYLESDLRTLTAVWIGNLRFRAALRDNRILLDGPDDLQHGFTAALKLSHFANITAAE